MVSPWEGGNHRVTMRRWKPQSHHGKVETTVTTWEGGNQSHHRKMETTVTMGRWKPLSSHGVTMRRWKPQRKHEGGNHRVNMGRWKPQSHGTWEEGGNHY